MKKQYITPAVFIHTLCTETNILAVSPTPPPPGPTPTTVDPETEQDFPENNYGIGVAEGEYDGEEEWEGI